MDCDNSHLLGFLTKLGANMELPYKACFGVNGTPILIGIAGLSGY